MVVSPSTSLQKAMLAPLQALGPSSYNIPAEPQELPSTTWKRQGKSSEGDASGAPRPKRGEEGREFDSPPGASQSHPGLRQGEAGGT